MLDEEGGQNRPDRVQAAEEGRGNAVEAHGGDGGLAALPLLIAGEVEHRRAETGQRTADGERQNQVAPFLLLPVAFSS